jgi:hypothetical protein
VPSQITHIVFGEEALGRGVSDAAGFLAEHGPAFRLGCQGPDLFYHNMRTRPSGIRYGVLLHRRHYGMVAQAMVQAARETAPQGAGAAYAAGFVTHGILDRATHPYIVFHSGWYDPAFPETRRYRRTHAFFERVLDVLVLRDRLGRDTGAFDCFRLLSCGSVLPASIEHVLAAGLEWTYARARQDGELRRRLANAYADSMSFYESTNPATPVRAQIAAELDRRDGSPRRLALFHPRIAGDPEVDFLNLGHAEWLHPCSGERHYESYPELYQHALEEAGFAVSTVFDALAGRGTLEAVQVAAGNGSLNLAFADGRPCAPRHTGPLPLPEYLAQQYTHVGHAGPGTLTSRSNR